MSARTRQSRARSRQQAQAQAQAQQQRAHTHTRKRARACRQRGALFEDAHERRLERLHVVCGHLVHALVAHHEGAVNGLELKVLHLKRTAGK
jgi:hypothetical protein